MRIKLLFALAAAVLLPVCSHAQVPAEWQDSLVDHLAGIWKVEGQVMGREAHHEVHAEWVLNHQFLRLHEKTTADAPKSEHPYEAFWFFSYDQVSERYVLHLMDIFGARYSETLATEAAKATRFASFSSILTDLSIRPIYGILRRTPGNG
jgi:hypothetical protein